MSSPRTLSLIYFPCAYLVIYISSCAFICLHKSLDFIWIAYVIYYPHYMWWMSLHLFEEIDTRIIITNQRPESRVIIRQQQCLKMYHWWKTNPSIEVYKKKQTLQITRDQVNWNRICNNTLNPIAIRINMGNN